jgi:hypothetical protein
MPVRHYSVCVVLCVGRGHEMVCSSNGSGTGSTQPREYN